VIENFSNQGSEEYEPNYFHPLVEVPDPDAFPSQTVWMLKKTTAQIEL
jgi:REP element-mobilizing transposase RayT